MHGADVRAIVPEIADRWGRSSGMVHMPGIGGVGMAGLALLLKQAGWSVSGCDAYDGPLLSWLRDQGIPAVVGHDPAHLDQRPDFIVRSPAVHLSEPELLRAMDESIPVVDRGQILPLLLNGYHSIAVAGTHGKTTTASMIAWILDQCGVETSFCIGGVCPGLDAVARAQPGGFMVVEADESDGTLRHYSPDIAVITSMDHDHVDYFQNENDMTGVFQQFAGQSGVLIYAADDSSAGRLSADHPHAVGFGVQAGGVRAENIRLESDASRFELCVNGRECCSVVLAISGRHNVINAAAALAVAVELGIDPDRAAAALARFRLPRRRFEIVATGRGITVVSDYAHHPVEIKALLAQAKLRKAGRMVAVFQPHRYSRTKAFLAEFAEVLTEVDELILIPVYPASEPFISGGATTDLLPLLLAKGMSRAVMAESVADGWELLKKNWREGDLVLVIGAGDVDLIGKWAAKELAAQ